MKKTEKKANNKANNKRSSMLAVLLAALLVLCVAAGTVIYKKANQKPAEQTAEPAKAEETEEEAQVWGDDSFGIDAGVDEALKDYRSIALLGIDAGSRSDVIMVVTINKNTNEAKVNAVHRDTYMQIDPNGTYEINGTEREFFKCNRAYKKNGIYGTMIELNRHMDLNIRECIAIDWDGIETLVDKLNGIEVNVTEGMIGLMNGQLDENNKITNPGVQTLNGKQAVQYLRCRKDPGSDATTRDARNQEVLASIFRRAKEMDMSELSDVYDDVANQLDTNMSRNTLTDTLATLTAMDLEETEGWPYQYSTLWQNDNSYYYFVADTLESNVIELHKTLFGQESYEPSETVMMLNEKLETARKEQLH